MSVEFRQRTPGEYASIVWRRKWLIALPAAAIALGVGWAVWKLPNVYESRTLLTVRPPAINASIVTQLTNDDLTVRINTIKQEVESRSSLEPLIQKYSLYAAERQRGEPMDALIERMRNRDIIVQINTSRNDVTNGFFLAFRGPDPRTTQAVTADLASKYTKEQAEDSSRGAMATREFFDRRLDEAKQKLDEIDQRRIKFMSDNMSHLPTFAPTMGVQLQGLREQQRALMVELGRMRTQRSLLETQLGDLQKQREQEIANIVQTVGDPKQTLAWAELTKRKAELEATESALLKQYKPKHPDVITVRSQVDSVKKQMDDTVKETKERITERKKQLESQIDPRINSVKYNVRMVEDEIDRQTKQLASAEAQIADIDRRINQVPGAEVGLELINREYQTAKGAYEGILKQSDQAKLVSQINLDAQGESIAVIDAANLPEQPVAPKRPLFMLLGLFAGLAVGLAFAAAFEVPRLLTIQTREDAEHYTGLPVLVTLPQLHTPREERRLRARRAGLAFAGVAAAVLAVPALAFVLTRLHLIEMIAMRG
jgi:polysaccharide chain length determinant protein (PEP-CTERM system associated)